MSVREEGERENGDRTKVAVTAAKQGRGAGLAGVRFASGVSAR
jgi:hypothetical protein